MTDNRPVLSLWEITPRGAYRAEFEWDETGGDCAGYLVLASTRDGHRLETAVSWAQLEAFHREATRRLNGRADTQETGELPRIDPAAPPPVWAEPTNHRLPT